MGFLIEGEQIVMKVHPSRVVYSRHYLIAALLVSLPFVYNFLKFRLPVADIYVVAVPVALAILIVAAMEISVRRSNYLITNYRVISRKGVFKRNIDSCTYDKMVNVKIIQTFPQRLLRIGTIDITTFQRSEIMLPSVPNPSRIEREIYKLIENIKTPATQHALPTQEPQPAAATQPVPPSPQQERQQPYNPPPGYHGTSPQKRGRERINYDYDDRRE